MRDLLTWLLDLSDLRLGQPGVEFGFIRPLEAWGWALVVIAACGLAWRSYMQLEGKRGARFVLGLLRAMLIVFIALLISGPQLVKPNEQELRDWVIVLVDRSLSMAIADVPTDDGKGKMTRESQLRRVLENSLGTWRDLSANRQVVWMGFDADAYEIRTNLRPMSGEQGLEGGERADGQTGLGEPMGMRTDLNRALEQALRKAAGRPISGVVVMSDGASIEEPSRALLRRLEAEHIPVFTLPLGNKDGVTDVGIARVEAPAGAFVNDVVPVLVRIERLVPEEEKDEDGEKRSGAAERTRVELIDNATQEVLAQEMIDWSTSPGSSASAAPPTDASWARTVRLAARSKVAGKGTWKVRLTQIRADGVSIEKEKSTAETGSGDLIEANNTADVGIELVDRPVRVLYIDGYPRWEYRYLKNLLVREESLSSAVLLLSPRRSYLQEGTVRLDALPRTVAEWSAFDVVILGDVWPGMFTTEQLNALKERVGVGGGGMVWIAGSGSTPTAWRSTPMGDLLPFVISDQGSTEADRGGIKVYAEPVMLRPTPAATRLGLLELAEKEENGSFWPTALSDPENRSLLLEWMQWIEPTSLKPAAEILAEATPASVSDGQSAQATPALMSMRYGAGRVIYIATDDLWRWRYAKGEPYTERFYIPILRLLGRESLARSGKPGILEATPSRARAQSPVRVRLTLLDQALIDAAAEGRIGLQGQDSAGTSQRSGVNTIRVKIETADDGAKMGGSEGRLLEEGEELLLGLDRGGEATGSGPTSLTFSSSWIPQHAGKFKVEVIDPLLTSYAAELSANVEVWQEDDEMRKPRADFELMSRLAQASGGKVLEASELSQLPKLLPNRKVRQAGEPEIKTLYDTPLALIVLVTLVGLEWIGRRLIRLA